MHTWMLERGITYTLVLDEFQEHEAGPWDEVKGKVNTAL